jgi:flagellar FliJ protein
MKKFAFRLQRLLDIREAREKEIKYELAALLNIQNMERMKQEEYRNRMDAEQRKFNEKLRAGKFSYLDSVMYERFIEFGNKVIQAAQERIDGMEYEISKVRERLVEASRERKVVERLKERKYEEFMYEYTARSPRRTTTRTRRCTYEAASIIQGGEHA